MKLVRLGLVVILSLVLLVLVGPVVNADEGGSGVQLKVEVVLPTDGGGGGGGGGGADTTAPRISDICLCPEGVTETTADICWVTNEKSTSQVEYWSSPSVLSPLDETLVIKHQVHLTGLTPGTTYHYKVRSTDRADNLRVSDKYTFTTQGKAPAAAFASSGLLISPSEVNIGEEVTIGLLVSNSGNATGKYKVNLKINGVVEATKEITLKAGASQKVTFTVAKNVAGSYSVAVNGLSGSFAVTEPEVPTLPPPDEAPPEVKPFNWPLVGGIIAAVVVVAGLLVFFEVRRRRAA